MSHIDEWEVPTFALPDPAAQPPATGKPPQSKTPTGPASTLARDIDARLSELSPAPAIVHFYTGEGLRWIRIGYDGDVPLRQAVAAQAGRAIAQCLGAASTPLYFHAMRPHDLLFFIEGSERDRDGLGMPAHFYGAPLPDVLSAWGEAPPEPSSTAPSGKGRPGKAAARSRSARTPSA